MSSLSNGLNTLVFLVKDKPNPLEKILSTDNTVILGQSELDKFCSDFCFLSVDSSKISAVVRANLDV